MTTTISPVRSKQFSGDMWDVRPRKFWQQLFNLFRELGGPLNSMDNLLIDLKLCEEAFDRLHAEKRVVFLWGFDRGGRFGCTRWIWGNDCLPGFEHILLGTDKCYRFTLEGDGYSMEELFEPEDL